MCIIYKFHFRGKSRCYIILVIKGGVGSGRVGTFALEVKRALSLVQTPVYSRGLNDLSGTSPSCSCHHPLYPAAQMACMHYSGCGSYWVSAPSLHWHPIRKSTQFWGTVAYTLLLPSLPVTPLAILFGSSSFWQVTPLLLRFLVSNRPYRMPAGSRSCGNIICFPQHIF